MKASEVILTLKRMARIVKTLMRVRDSGGVTAAGLRMV